MIKNINKRILGEILEVEIETKIKTFYFHENKVLTDEEVLNIVSKDHEVLETISKPNHKVGNYQNSGTKSIGVWSFKIKTEPSSKIKAEPSPKRKTNQKPNPAPKKEEKPLTKTSIRSRISKVAKKLNEEDEPTE